MFFMSLLLTAIMIARSYQIDAMDNPNDDERSHKLIQLRSRLQQCIHENERRLLEAAFLGETEEIERALAAGASIHASVDGITALHFAAGQGHAEAAHVLIIHNANIEATSNIECLLRVPI